MFKKTISNLRNRFRWWRAKRYGQHPDCGECGRDATWYTTDRGYLCMACQSRTARSNPVAAIRDLKPADYLEDDPGLKPYA